MKLKEVGEKAFVREVIRADRPVLVHFYAAWCSFSLEIGPIVEKLAKELGSEVKAVRVDSKNKKLMARLGVTRFPTQMLFVDGQKVDEILGATTEASLRSMVKDGIALRRRALAAAPTAGTTIEVVEATFGRRVLQSEIPVLAVFWARSCAGSLKLLDHINEATAASKKAAAKMRVVQIEVDRAPGVAARFQVSRLPTTLVFENGEVVDKLGGALSPKSIGKVFKAYS
jgi:thioredoxin 1